MSTGRMRLGDALVGDVALPALVTSWVEAEFDVAGASASGHTTPQLTDRPAGRACWEGSQG